MKRINKIIAGVIVFYLLLFAAVIFFWSRQTREESREYLVEAGRLMRGMEEQKSFSMPVLHDSKLIEAVSYLSCQDMGNTQAASVFFSHKNGYAAHIEPLVVDGEVLGLVRFDYRNIRENKDFVRIPAGVLIISLFFVLTILVYARERIVKPFWTLSNLPYELSRGHMQMEVEENKEKFFGKFVWGIDMLRDNLQAAQKKSLRLEKEKKMLLLSLSHDIKTPLNSIKLYAKALDEGVYESEEERRHALYQIECLAGEIEKFVQKIERSSSEALVSAEVENSEFYLREFVEMIKAYYEPKCRLVMTEFTIGAYENRLIRGDKDRAMEVVENLMENAFKYGDGGQIGISFQEEEGCQLVRIRNTGNAVNAEEMPRLFDSFYRGSNVGAKEGNGLGLYICREIMQKMDGEIFAQAENDGMSFFLVFPM